VTNPVPSVGRIVHYVSYGTPGGEYTSQCRAAIITEVGPGLLPDVTEQQREHDSAVPVVGLCVLNPTGLFFKRAEHDEGKGASGAPDCPTLSDHGDPLRYCGCGWTEDHHRGGTWHWPERV
jgi:hypothetical protein